MSSLRKTVFALFFLSGFCGLLYQVVWIRLAFSHFGIIMPVLSVVVSVFMLGLALGSWAGGVWTSRKTRRFSAIYAYAAVEFLIGWGAFLVPKLFPLGDTLLLPGGDLNSGSYLLFSALIISVSLLPWCFLMGTTFPLMMAFIKEQETSGAATSFSFLYLANVIGAMCGTLITADVLVELIGFKNTLLLAGCTNFLIAAISVSLGKRYPFQMPAKTAKGEDARKVPARVRLDRPILWYYTVLFVTGFTSMSLEVIWVRNFTPVVGTTVYAFALIVTVYLLATWMGSGMYRRDIARKRPLSIPALLAALAVSTLFIIVINDPRLRLEKGGLVLGIFPFSWLLGYLTPSLIDRYSQGDPDRAGRAYAINIIGCILGPLMASYLFLPSLGAKGSMVLMALPYVILLAMHLRELPHYVRVYAGSAAALLLVSALWINRSYEEPDHNGVIRRDSTATVISTGEGMGMRLLVNGVGITQITTITKVMAYLPLLTQKEPRSALNICFGMGTTYRSLLKWDGVQVTAVELVPSVKEAFGYYHTDAAQVMANPRGRVVIDDGRRFLRRTGETFDVITLDPPPPIEAAGSSLLYAREFYELAKKRLRPSGVLHQWFPGGLGVECQAITRSLTDAFPYVKAFGSAEGWGIHYLASMQPIQLPTAAQSLARFSPAVRADLLEWQPKADLRAFWKDVLAREIKPEVLMSSDPSLSITDDRPFNEYYLLRRSWAYHKRKFTQKT
jgi:spermidine synthase